MDINSDSSIVLLQGMQSELLSVKFQMPHFIVNYFLLCVLQSSIVSCPDHFGVTERKSCRAHECIEKLDFFQQLRRRFR